MVIRVKEPGIIEKIFPDSYGNIPNESILGRPLADLYHLPPVPLDAIVAPLAGAGDPGWFESKNAFENFDTVFNLYTTIPCSKVRFFSAPNGNILGLILFKQFGRKVSFIQGIPAVFINTDGVVNAFNNEFLLRFLARFKSAGNLLGQPSSALFKPDPFRFIVGLPEDYQALKRLAWQPYLAFPGAAATPWIPDSPDIEKREDGLRWSARSKEDGHFLMFRFQTDTVSHDYRFILRIRIQNGPFPCFILNGDPREPGRWPDSRGYLLGFTPDHGFFRIKKKGVIHLEAKNGITPMEREYLVEIVKRGDRLAFFIDGKLFCGYRDPAPLDRPDGLFYLCSRADAELLIVSMSVERLPKARETRTPVNEVVFQNNEDNAFCFFQLVDRAAFLDDQFLHALLFTDVLALKRNIRRLEDQKQELEGERDRYKAMTEEAGLMPGEFVGTSPAVQRLKEAARMAARSSATILLEGETGTGKTLFARYIHEQSDCRNGPFVKVDCASLPESLLESELFGHVKGAFTGADRDRTGKFEEAEGGTLFLDEIGNLSLSVQAKLLSFLQDFTIQRLGGNRSIVIRTRVITATNRNLQELITAGAFRSDLYYRLNAIRFEIPPLRERKEDIPPLLGHFLAVYNRKFNRAIKGFSSEASRRILSHDWPGNTRELENFIQKAVLFTQGEEIGAEMVAFPEEIADNGEKLNKGQAGAAIPFGNARALRKEHILALLERNNNIVKWAAREAKVGEATLFRKIRKFSIRIRRE